ncbi:malate--CoA ligase subunit beta [Sorangium cellulosum]|uniref:Succinate--CoA ligase [ADP-forming] subunit beta n=1 Tax=Sorangium cellulosum TaxID=56 RepID=A0A2L0FC63_SORCE|nr:ADP-forming succinate--CoA ligase subunit beta [Sorangium cellulosum]AUX49009.1 malate--CoA ligase subunit beta [Sorangium cellulosum]
MKIHEYQGKQLFARYGVPVPKGEPAFQASEVAPIADRLIAQTGNPVVVVKAQIHAGGRGKGGGVKVAKGGSAEASAIAEKLLGMQLVTKQTGPEGQKVQRLYVEQGLDIARELYFAMLVDRERRRVAVIASTEGGMDIEEVAHNTPEKIVKLFVDPLLGLAPYQARQLALALGLTAKETQRQFLKTVSSLYAAFTAEDCALLEINPLIVTGSGDIVALDAKVSFDDNAEFRHPEWNGMRDVDEEDAVELQAKRAGLSYVSLDGDIGCLVNGAGLAMATMDIILHYGGKPANFLDVGGGASQEQVKTAFQIILRSERVRGIFVNIFGGIMRCDVVAGGVIAAAKELGLKVPLVVRLEGTNVEAGRKLLDESGLTIQSASSMADGAQKIVAATAAGKPQKIGA